MSTKNLTTQENPASAAFASEIEGFTAAWKLSRREGEIIVAMISSITGSDEIADALGISTHTVNNHLKSIFVKIGTNSKTGVLSAFLRYAADRHLPRTEAPLVRRPRVLIIDDDSVGSGHLAKALTDRGLKAITLSEPERSVEMISKFNIDFVVCNVRTPTMNGMEVLKHVRSLYRCWPHFIFISGSLDHSRAECMSLGASDVVGKLNVDALYGSIMGHLTQSGDDRKNLLGISTITPVVIENPISLNADDLGFGGAFVALDAVTQRQHHLAVGSVVDLTLMVPKESSPLHVRGQVVWIRPAVVQGLKPGIGVKFFDLSERDQSIFDGLLQASKTSSFIPLGRISTAS